MDKTTLEKDIEDAENKLPSSEKSFALLSKYNAMTETLELESARQKCDVAGELIALVKLNRLDEFMGVLKGNRYEVNDNTSIVYLVCQKHEFLVAYHDIMSKSNFAKFNLLAICFETLNNKGIEYLLANNPTCHRLQVDYDHLYCESIYTKLFDLLKFEKSDSLLHYIKQTIINDDLFVNYFYGNYFTEKLIASQEALDLQERVAIDKLKEQINGIKTAKINAEERISNSCVELQNYEPIDDDLFDLENNEHYSLIQDISSITDTYMNLNPHPIQEMINKQIKGFSNCEIHQEHIPLLEWLYELGFDVYSIYYYMSEYKKSLLINDMELFFYFSSVPKTDFNFDVLAWKMNLQQIFDVAVKLNAMPPKKIYSEPDDDPNNMIDNGTLRNKIMSNLRLQLRSLRKPKEQAIKTKVKKI